VGGLVPDQAAEFEVERGGEGPRWVPEDAVVRRGQLAGVFSVESDTLRLRWVRLGQTWGDAVELLAGPTGELEVVRNPSPDLWDGRAVGVLNIEQWSAPGADREVPLETEVVR